MTRQDLGRATEARFLLDACRRGYLVSRPFADAPGYDVILDTRKKLLRVQIKGARPAKEKSAEGKDYYRITVSRNRSLGDGFDVLAIYLEGRQEWLFTRREDLTAKRQIQISDTQKYSRTHRLRGWEVLGK